MARDEDSTRGKVVASVPLVIGVVLKEDTKSRTGSQLVRSGGGGVRVTHAPKDSKVILARRGTEESVVWRGSWAGSGRNAVKEASGGVQALSPEATRKRGLKEKSAHDVVGGANHALSLAVLRGGIRARHAQLDIVREKEGTGGGVIELPTIVTQDSLGGEAELCGHPSEKLDERGKALDFARKGKVQE
jgi:hypothetical protein